MKEQIRNWLLEDEWEKNTFYAHQLPKNPVKGILKIKEPMVLSGLYFFLQVFEEVGGIKIKSKIMESEGRLFDSPKNLSLDFPLDFKTFISGERLALNLLQRSSSISTMTKRFVDKVHTSGVKVLDTRKTTPGLRSLEKYAVRLGGGYNHRFSQTDSWMIKDNHKKMFGGLKEAYSFFKSLGTPYQSIICEIHSQKEFQMACDLGINFIMLDNFSPEEIKSFIKAKPKSMHIEISGGIQLDTIDNFCFDGVDAISIGSLTSDVPRVDLSLKIGEVL